MPTPDSDAPCEVHDCEREGCFAPPPPQEQPQSWGAVKARRKRDSGLDDC